MIEKSLCDKKESKLKEEKSLKCVPFLNIVQDVAHILVGESDKVLM